MPEEGDSPLQSWCCGPTTQLSKDRQEAGAFGAQAVGAGHHQQMTLFGRNDPYHGKTGRSLLEILDEAISLVQEEDTKK